MSFEEDNEKVKKGFLDALEEMTTSRSWEGDGFEICMGRENIKELKSFLSSPSKRRKKVLEIGCGYANSATYLVNMGLEYYGVDVNLNIYRAKCNQEGVHLYQMDAHELAFPDGFFDAVFSCYTFHYMTDKLRGLKEAHRVLRTGGKGCIHIDPSYFFPSGETLIATNQQESDIFWDDRKNAVIIAKNGKGHSFEQLKYSGYERCFSHPSAVISSYKQ